MSLPTTAVAPPAIPTAAGATSRRRAILSRIERTTRPIVALAIMVLIWHTLVRVQDIEPFLLPAPADVARALVSYSAYLSEAWWATLGHILGGYAAGAAAGLVMASVLVLSPYLRGAILPLLVGVQAVPKVALAPLLIIWLGFGASSKLTLVGLLCFFPVVVSTMAGMQRTPAEAIELAQCYRSSTWQILLKIRIWYALPQVFSGLKIAMTLALIGAVIAQMSNPNSGLGAIILRGTQQGNTALTFAAIVILAVTGITLYYTLTLVERLLLPWSRETTA